MREQMTRFSVDLIRRSMRSLAGRSQKAANDLELFQKCRLEFTPCDDDIFIVTYPRSGTTWLQMILYQLISDGEMDFSHIQEKAPWFERAIRQESDLSQLASPRIFKSHLQYRFIPRGQCRYIYVIRDGRDVAVSYFFLHRAHNGFSGSFDDFWPLFCSGQLAFGSWFDHVRAWQANRAGLNVLYLRYEALKVNPTAAIQNIATFCALPLDQARLERTVERSSLEYMKAHAGKFDFASQIIAEQEAVRIRLDEERTFLGSGEIGGWSAYLSPEQLAEYREAYLRRFHVEPSLSNHTQE